MDDGGERDLGIAGERTAQGSRPVRRQILDQTIGKLRRSILLTTRLATARPAITGFRWGRAAGLVFAPDQATLGDSATGMTDPDDCTGASDILRVPNNSPGA